MTFAARMIVLCTPTVVRPFHEPRGGAWDRPNAARCQRSHQSIKRAIVLDGISASCSVHG
jgi:hypothetical protein